MSLKDQWSLAVNTEVFVQRVEGAVVHAAIAVASEDINTANHAARVVLASKVLANPSFYANLFAWGVADNATVQADWPAPAYRPNGTDNVIDNDIQFTVNSIFNAYT